MDTMERPMNRRVTRMELEAHQARRRAAVEGAALQAANEALEPMRRAWWARAARWLRGLVGKR